MIPVSNAWKAVQNNTLLPEMFVEITYTITEPGLQEAAVASGSHAEDFANTQDITKDERVSSDKYVSLDYGLWGLDGKSTYSTGNPVNPGYVTEHCSDENGLFPESEKPTLRFDFSGIRRVLIPGITITWSEVFNCWAEDFVVTAYNSSGMVAQKTITGNKSVVSTVQVDLIDYNAITIEVLRWSHPWQSCRCIGVRFGVQSVYTKSDLLSYEHTQNVDLLSAALPENKISFSLRNDDNRWNPDNLTGSERYLFEQQEMTVRYGMDVDGAVEWIKGGTFWLTEWQTPSNGMEATFTAQDATCFLGDTYSGITSGTLYAIADAAFKQADLPNAYVIDEVLSQYETSFAEDSSYTIADILQMIAHAGCCVFYQDRSGVLHITPKSDSYCGYIIEPAISYSHPEYTISKPLKAVSVGYGGDQRVVLSVAARGETQTVDNEFLLTEADARRVAEKTKDVLEKRKEISGEFRADLRLDALDNIIVTSKYASNIISITGVTYSTTGGAFRGSYTGRVTAANLKPTVFHSNEIYSGEVW